MTWRTNIDSIPQLRIHMPFGSRSHARSVYASTKLLVVEEGRTSLPEVVYVLNVVGSVVTAMKPEVLLDFTTAVVIVVVMVDSTVMVTITISPSSSPTFVADAKAPVVDAVMTEAVIIEAVIKEARLEDFVCEDVAADVTLT
jgi:hypothetical protein